MRRLYIFFLLFISCEQDENFILITNVYPEGSGSTSQVKNIFLGGDEVIILANPNEYYDFDSWSGDYESNNPEIKFKIISNVSITANFKLLDSDMDGVADKDDLCKKTQTGTKVNSVGCSEVDNDYDNDGVINIDDNCPNTPNNTSVNNSGCSLIKLDENGTTLKATFYASDYLGEVVLYKGDSVMIVRDWNHIRSLGPSTYNKEVRFATSFIEEIRELCSLPCVISDKFDMSSWDVSGVKSMYFTFWNTNGFNQDISNWDVSGVQSMEGIFFHAYNTNVDISSWDVSNVKNMKRMFRGALYANPDVSLWDVSQVTDMKEMFMGTDIAQDLKNWDVSNVTNMEKMFYDAKNFNQDLSIWDVGNVSECNSFYENASSWNLPKPSFINCDP